MKITNINKIHIQTASSIILISPYEIVYCAAEKGKTVIKIKSGENIATKTSLQVMQEKLGSDSFYRCHAKFLVNLNAIDRYMHKSGELQLIDGTVVKVAKERRVDFYQIIIFVYLFQMTTSHFHCN